MNGFLLILCGSMDDTPIRFYPTRALAAAAAKAFGSGLDTGIETGATTAPPCVRHAARVMDCGTSESMGWKIVEFRDDVPYQSWVLGWDDEWELDALYTPADETPATEHDMGEPVA